MFSVGIGNCTKNSVRTPWIVKVFIQVENLYTKMMKVKDLDGLSAGGAESYIS